MNAKMLGFFSLCSILLAFSQVCVCVSKCPYVGLLCSSENGFDTSHGMHGPEPALSVFLFGLLGRQKRVGK